MTKEVISNLKEFFKEVFPRESKEFLKLAFPLILTYILTMFIQLETLFCKILKINPKSTTFSQL